MCLGCNQGRQRWPLVPLRIRICAALTKVAQRFPVDNSCDLTVPYRCSHSPPTKLFHPSLSFLNHSPKMKTFKKKIRQLRSRIADRDSPSMPSEGSAMPSMQPGAIPSGSNTHPTRSKDKGTLALERRHIDSDTRKELVSDPVSLKPRASNSRVPDVQTKASDITNIMQHVDPKLMEKFG